MLPLALAAVAQAIVVIGGGIDLSIGSMMALVSVVAATLMKGQTEEFGVLVVIGVLLFGILLGAINGALIVVTRVPDIVVTLAMSFVWAGCALLVLSTPGGGSAQWLKDLVIGSLGSEWIPKAAVVLLVVVAVIWLPVRRSTLGLSIYAIGSNQLAAFRSGVSVGRTKVMAYGLMGLFAALGGLSLTASTGIGTPVPGPYTLLSVAAVVLGGVSLAGGTGGVFGPIVAVVILQLIRTDMTFLNINSEPGRRRPGDHPHRGRHGRQPHPDPAGPRMSSAPRRRSEWLTVAIWRRAVPRPAARPADRAALIVWSSSAQAVQPGVVDPAWASIDPAGAVPLAILAGCQTLTMLTGGIDLSVGAVASMAGFVDCDAGRWPGWWSLALAVALFVAGLAGLDHRHRRRRLPGPPADHDPRHGAGRARSGQCLAAGHGPDRVRGARRSCAISAPARSSTSSRRA